MKLVELEIRNYRSLFHYKDESFLLRLGDGVNVVAGPNNTGKSNIFRALALALDPDFRFEHGDKPVIIACDWSGRRDDDGGTWVAKAVDGALVDLRPKTRSGAIEYVVAEARHSDRLVAGFDFAFSFPAWFVEQLAHPPELWQRVRDCGEEWLARCEAPFWGRPGATRPLDREVFRSTEQAMRRLGFGSKSAFQIGGAGAVGTGSIRGMPLLLRLEEAGFGVWPFQSFCNDGRGRWPRVVEIYPRALTGPVNKTSRAAREEYLGRLDSRMTDWMFDLAAWSEDAFDAVVSALAMADHVHELVDLQPTNDLRLLEGEIWAPPSDRQGAVRRLLNQDCS